MPVPQPVQPVQPIQPAQPVPSQYLAPQPVAQPVQQQAAGETAVDQLVELAKVLGMDNLVTNWENLKKFAAQLDEEEKRMQKELEELQNKLNLVRMTRELLRRIGI
jgi:vancomycin resistance protein YoaR